MKNDKADKRITFRLREKEYNDLELVKGTTGLTTSQVIRAMITTVYRMMGEGCTREADTSEYEEMFASLEGGDSLPHNTAVPKYNHHRGSCQ